MKPVRRVLAASVFAAAVLSASAAEKPKSILFETDTCDLSLKQELVITNTIGRCPKQLGVDGSLLKDMDIFCPATCFWNPKQVECRPVSVVI